MKELQYKTVEATSIKQTSNPNEKQYSSIYKEAFDSASEDYWKFNTKNGYFKYSQGKLLAKLGGTTASISDVFDRLSNFIKETIRSEYNEKNLPTQNLVLHFNTIDNIFKLLAREIETTNKDIDVSQIMACLQGFINGYIDNVLNDLNERNTNNGKT